MGNCFSSDDEKPDVTGVDVAQKLTTEAQEVVPEVPKPVIEESAKEIATSASKKSELPQTPKQSPKPNPASEQMSPATEKRMSDAIAAKAKLFGN